MKKGRGEKALAELVRIDPESHEMLAEMDPAERLRWAPGRLRYIKARAKMPRTISDTELHTWFERDRQHVELRDKKTGRTLVEWWDEAVSEAVEDGFLNPRRFHESAWDYFQNEMGGVGMRQKSSTVKSRWKNPKGKSVARKRMSAQARKDFAVRMAKARGVTVARRRAQRRANPAKAGGFQIAALCRGKVCYLAGLGLSSNRDTASSFAKPTAARRVAGQVRDLGAKLGVTKVAIISRHDPAPAVQRFLLGKA